MSKQLQKEQELPSENHYQRIQVVDVLRGFALFGILLIHSLQKFLNHTTMGLLELGPKNKFVKSSVEFLIEDKFFIIFSFLFGWSFYVMYQSAIRKQIPFIRLYIWRLVVLLAIGTFHTLFFDSDILQVYAVIGLILIFCRDFTSRTILVLSILLFLGSIPCIIFREEIWGAIISMKNFGIPLPNKLGYYIFTGRLFTTSSMFVLGLYAGKINLFSNIYAKQNLLKKVVVFSCCIFLTTLTILTLSKSAIDFPGYSADKILQVICFALQNISLSCLYVSALTLLYYQTKLVKSLRWLIPLGRIGLSAYLMQSIFFQLYYNLYDGMEMGLPGAMAITLLFFFGQIFFANLWLSRFRFGPVEWIWRSLTSLIAPSK
jgi:uncharacterized protein